MPTLFPYTTLFRSLGEVQLRQRDFVDSVQRAIDGLDRVDVGLKRIPDNAPSKIFEGNPRFEQRPFTGINGAVEATRLRRRGVHELLHIGVAADDAIEGHDVRCGDLGREIHEIPTEKTDLLTMPLARRLLLGDVDICIRSVNMDCRPRSRREQFVMNDADACANIE